MKSHCEVERLDNAEGIFWKYRGHLYPDRLTKKNAMGAIEKTALKHCQGGGIDIGAGRFPFSNARPIQNDKTVNAYNLSDIPDKSLDYVFSSHCLEHLGRPFDALDEWISKIKLGGTLFLYLPHHTMELWKPGAPWVGEQHKWVPKFDDIVHYLTLHGMEIVAGDGERDAMYSFYLAAKKTKSVNPKLSNEIDADHVRKFFENKTVIVLGSAPNVTTLNASFMEKFDLIARVNNYSAFNECHRTDVYVSFYGKSIRTKLSTLKRDKCKLMLCKCPRGDVTVNNPDGTVNDKLSGNFDWIYDFRHDWFKQSEIPFYISSADDFNENNKLVGQVCTTGTAAILDILRHNPKQLYFAGFDFAMSGVHNINQKMIFKPYPNVHHFEQEFHLMKKLVAEKENLDCSPEIKKLLQNEYVKASTWIQ